MTKQGKYNIIGMLLLPAAAVLGAWVGKQNGVWEPYAATYIWLAQINFVLMLVIGLVSGLLLRRSGGDTARWLAVAPTLVVAVWGGLWYLWRAVFPAEIAAGAEYIGALQYLAVFAIAAFVVVLLLRVTRLVPRTA